MRTMLKLIPGFKTPSEHNYAEKVPVIRMVKNKATFYQMIVFPHVELTDPYKSTMFKVLTQNMEKSFVEYQHLDICSIRDLVKLSGMTIWGRAADAYDWLDKLHCVKFKDMHPEIALQVPHRINMVFSNGEYEYPWEMKAVEHHP
ncbi:hypothetical protein QMZ93_07195 [Pantoea stewartii subsp. indologenes]|uniref:hypothetical protein n=1 Tax=Pantoea stewartii TaxID=66269 RepID=UPI0024DFFF50|nr:hypothetical protein [Pantoea stewartii]MDK2633127.1 hypothetical protein [Pantoea stewartii subsp. indologenes]